MRADAVIGGVDLFGAEGGRLASAFAAGCIATFAFMSAVGGFIWRMIGSSREDRIKELADTLKAEQERCSAMEERLVSRIEQLETILLFEVAGNVRQNAHLAIAELRNKYERHGADKEE